jgi:type I restriction enzyme R subunit
MAFNENTRVKIPAILHLCRLGYDYLPIRDTKRDEKTNIFVDIFSESLRRINKDIVQEDIDKVLENLTLTLDNDDLGKAFYEMLTSTSGIKVIDFKDFEKNIIPCGYRTNL